MIRFKKNLNKIHNSLFSKEPSSRAVGIIPNSAKSEGFGLLEVVIGVTIISVSLFSLIIVLQSAMVIINESTKDIQASFLLEEGVESVRVMRDSGWTSNIAGLATSTSYYFDFNGSTWLVTTSNIYIDGLFERSFVIDDVYRDVNDDIAISGTLDANTKKVTVYIAWSTKSGTTTKNIATYLTNLFDN